MWVITQKEEALLTAADGQPLSTKPKPSSGLKPGDYHISEDERSVYTVAKDGSLRRVKDKDQANLALDRLHKLKTADDERQAAAKAKNEAPLTHVDDQALLKIASLMTLGAALSPSSLEL